MDPEIWTDEFTPLVGFNPNGELCQLSTKEEIHHSR